MVVKQSQPPVNKHSAYYRSRFLIKVRTLMQTNVIFELDLDTMNILSCKRNAKTCCFFFGGGGGLID